MRKLIIVISIIVFMLSGCVSSVVKDKLSSNAAKLDGYVRLMDAGETTPEQDQNLIRVMRILTWSMNHAVNGETPPLDVALILEGGVGGHLAECEDGVCPLPEDSE